MGTLFIRFVEKGLSINVLEDYLLSKINERTPKGLIKKDRSPNKTSGGDEGIKYVQPGDLVVIIHGKGYRKKSGLVAIGRATTRCLVFGQHQTDPPLGKTEPFAVCVESIEWFANRISTTSTLRPALEIIDPDLKLDGPGWRYSTYDFSDTITDLLSKHSG